MAGKIEVLKASLFDQDREQMKAIMAKYPRTGANMGTRLNKFFFGVNPIIMIYYAMVMDKKDIPINLVEKVNRALAGLVVSKDILEAVSGPGAEYLPVLVVDIRFTGKACVPFVVDADGHLSLLALNLGQFVESFGVDQLEKLKGI